MAAGNTNDITIGPITATGMMCTPELASQELAYLEALQTASSYTINGTTLTLTTASGPLTYGAAVVSDGSYGIDEGLIFSYPLTYDGAGNYKIVQGLSMSDFAQAKVQATLEELRGEKEAVADLL